MEQIYMLEILLDRVTIFLNDHDSSASNKRLIVNTKFGPKTTLPFREGMLIKDMDPETALEFEDGRSQWTRMMRVGKSILFHSHPDNLQKTLGRLPLEIEIYSDDENENPILVGVGKMTWDKTVYEYLRESAETEGPYFPWAKKQEMMLKSECCCKLCGRVTLFIRLNILGDSILSEFQQLARNDEEFVFRNNKTPSTVHCKRIESDNINFLMSGPFYETLSLEDPSIAENLLTLEICTDHDTCPQLKSNIPRPIETIKMGEIKGPCGHRNCALAQKVRQYIRRTFAYRQNAAIVDATQQAMKDPTTSACICSKVCSNTVNYCFISNCFPRNNKHLKGMPVRQIKSLSSVDSHLIRIPECEQQEIDVKSDNISTRKASPKLIS